jgi:hypothetical protein
MKRMWMLVFGLTMGLSACGGGAEQVSFEGTVYRSDIKTERGSRDQFTVTAKPVSASLAGAREAARYEAITYCINRYGNSDIIWAVGPESPDEALPISNDTLTLQGRCTQ